MENLKLTEKEFELITVVRSFKKSKHNPSFEMEMYIRELFEDYLSED